MASRPGRPAGLFFPHLFLSVSGSDRTSRNFQSQKDLPPIALRSHGDRPARRPDRLPQKNLSVQFVLFCHAVLAMAVAYDITPAADKRRELEPRKRSRST